MKKPLLIFIFTFTLYAESFIIANYNVQNLFDMHRDGGEYEEYIPSQHNWTERMMQTKLNHISDVLCDMDAQIVALEEIENDSILEKLQQRLKRVGCAYPHRAITHHKHSAIQVALLSRYPLKNIRELVISRTARDRPILEVTAMIDAHPLTLFINHWKAKSSKGSESRRVRYAKVLAGRLARLNKDREYIIIGDFNSHYDEYQRMDKRLDDTGGITGINHILKSIDKGELIREEQMMSSSQGYHYNLWLELAISKRWNYKFYNNKVGIDHMLLPRTLFDGKGIDYQNNSFGVFAPTYLFNKKGWINSWQYKQSKHKGKGYSDHLPIYAKFDFKPYQKQQALETIEGTIEQLYEVDKLEKALVLKNATVMLKRGNNAIIKQSQSGRAIYLYGVAKGLVEGHQYDLEVNEINYYNGLKEIVDMRIIKKRGEVALDRYYLHAQALNPHNLLLQNEVFSNLRGVYKKGKLEIDNKKIPIYFKRKNLIPKDGSKLKILYAHLGYYRKPQLVIYDQNDFILER